MKPTNDFNELQQMWINQRVDEVSAQKIATNVDSIMGKLKSLQKRQDRVNKLKILTVTLILLSIVPTIFRLDLQGDKLINVLIGFSIILTSLIAFFTYYLQNQLRVSRLPFGQSTENFINSAIHQLRKQNAIFRLPFLLFILGMLTGLNFLMLGMTSNADMALRIQIHGLSSLFLLIAAFMGYRVRHYRTRQEVLPIIKELMEAKEKLGKE
ncbi:MAG: hypothetical protein RBT74_14750 [Tenuifilaceae bacterium]|jgi:hypothetical protein|nr:hypothetical protein [Tenuifilaceae bacterium]